MERICVMVRIRPLDSLEEAKASLWRVSGNTISLHNQPTKFDFDRIFKEESKNSDIYQARAKDIVRATVRGFNGTVFAYGQTNSGKTHTMRGKPTEPGVIPLAVNDLFHVISEVEDREFLLRMSYMEIYNEEINDLLVPEHRKLQIHESLERGIFVAGLREEIVVSPEQVLEFMEFGESHRHIGETNMNVYSSRSHTIFRMIIESRERHDGCDAESPCDAVRVSVLNLVDLAGSERVAKTGAEGVRLKEGSHINRSLMTLGTVINKLSEGAESVGGHVPYRDSKLTRILQPALGGNSNTAIICNITLAQVHTDETRSSLQFATRALRVTNCAQVNEILTDAALLKRQKKEIEDLRAKLMDSHSEHLEEEILSLRNTLLQSEVERERIALELQAEKKAQATREQRLQEQARKIANLSTMVLYSTKDPREKYPKKGKRRETWCPGGPYGKPLEEDNGINTANAFMAETNDRRESLNGCVLPDEQAMLRVTHRRKVTFEDIGSPEGTNDLLEIKRKYEELLMDFETLKATKDVEISSLKNQLTAECGRGGPRCARGTNLTERESEAILVIKQLQDQISKLEMEKLTIQKNLDNLVELATEQNVNASKKCDELCNELLDAREETRVAREQLTSVTVTGADEMGNPEDFLVELDAIKSELECLRDHVDSVFLFAGDLLCNFNELLGLLPDYKSEMHKHIMDLKLKNEKERCHEYEEQNALLVSQVYSLQKEISGLSTSSLVKEKEVLRKDLEKTRAKLKDTESKLKNCIQDKVKLESERANNEKELKHLLGQCALLERDISKRESIAGRRNDKASDVSREKSQIGVVEQSLQLKTMELEKAHFDLEILLEKNRILETSSFEMEEKLAALEEYLTTAKKDTEEAMAQSEFLASELGTASNNLAIANSQINLLTEEASSLQLTNALIGLEEERAIWLAKEKDFATSIREKGNCANAEIALLSENICKARDECQSLREQCNILEEKLSFTEASLEKEKKRSTETLSEIDRLKELLKRTEVENVEYQDVLKSRIDLLSSEKRHIIEEVEKLQKQLNLIAEEKNKLAARCLQDSERHKLAKNFNKDVAKLRIRLHNTQAMLDVFRCKYEEAEDEKALMKKRYEEASKKLKDELVSSRLEQLDLRKQLSEKE
ncbi:Kinesin-related protein 4 [Nymphaea thermarum]|nr:Kinesin-related protein 4 [Nymphaea thermarum]